MARKSLCYGILLFISCSLSWQLNAQYILELDSIQAFPGDQVSMGISIQNAGQVTSFQCDIPFPSDVNIDPQSVTLNPGRSADHLISATLVQDTILRILCFSMNNTPFNGNQGEVAAFELSLPLWAMEANLPLINALVANTNGQNVLTATLDGAIKTMGPLSVELIASSDSICLGATLILEAVVSGGGWYPDLNWTSDPIGFEASGYIVSDEPEISKLYFISVDDGYQAAADTQAIIVFEPPWVEAGEDQLICFGETVDLNASYEFADSLIWSGGNGSFDDPHNANTMYYPADEDLEMSEIWLVVQAFGNALCDFATDSVLVTIHTPAEAIPGSDYVVPLDEFYENSDAVVYGTDSLFWTSNGDGTFNNTSLLHPVYWPGARDKLNGEVSLKLHAIPTLPCQPVADSLQLIVLREGDNVMQLPTNSANPNDTILLTLNIENRTSFNSFSATMLLPEGMSWIVSTAQLTDRAVDHQLSVELSAQQLNCIAYSPTNQDFIGSSGSVFQIQVITSMFPGIYALEILAGSMINEVGDNIITGMVNGELNLILVGNDPLHAIDNQFDLKYLRYQKCIQLILPESCDLTFSLFTVGGKLTGRMQKSYPKGTHFFALAEIAQGKADILQARIIRVSIHPTNQTTIHKVLKLW